MATPAKPRFDPKAFLATVARGRTVSTYAKDAIVYRQAGPADAVHYVQKGKIKIVVASKQGKEAVIAMLGPGEFFGEGCLIGQPLRLATATAIGDSEVTRVGKAEMTRTTSLSLMATAVASRSGWPVRHPSPRNSSAPSIATSASLPCFDATTILILRLPT
jgi:CRP-like cAMP-binding protein